MEGASHALAASSAAPIPDIMQEHSPPKKAGAKRVSEVLASCRNRGAYTDLNKL